MKNPLVLLLLTSLLIVSPVLHAEISSRAKSPPERRWFFITEAGATMGMFENSGKFVFNLDFGGMYNLNKHSALGATFFAVFNDYSFTGFKIRYRHRLSSSFSLDISPGLSLWGGGNHPQFSGHIGLNYKDLVALIGQLDISRHTYIDSQLISKKHFSLGLKFGSQVGKIITLAGAVAAVVGIVIAIIALSD